MLVKRHTNVFLFLPKIHKYTNHKKTFKRIAPIPQFSTLIMLKKTHADSRKLKPVVYATGISDNFVKFVFVLQF